MLRFENPRTLLLFGLATLLVLGWLAYAPGLAGGFLFDDYANLPALGATGPVDTWPTFWRYITSGSADPTGRPLALLSFLLDARDWPTDPRPFLRTNVLLHLLNGVLLALLLRKLGRGAVGTASTPGASEPSPLPLSRGERGSELPLFPGERGSGLPFSWNDQASYWWIDLAALLGAAFWLLHPLFVSTTLYIVQREAILPATFALLGLLSWLHGRSRMLAGSTWAGLAWIALGLGAGTLLAVLSKANGILLPALALVIDYVWLRRLDGSRLRGAPTPHISPVGAPLRHDHIPRNYTSTLLVFGWLPALVVLGYLLDSAWNGLVHGISATRPWTLGQRLLTEPRVLMDYLALLWLPRPFTPGLFNDQIAASTSLWSPATTLPAILAVIGLIAGAWLLRKRFPAIALATLFYFVGQSLESSSIALELYFEHRNYLPAMLMFWPLARGLLAPRSHETREFHVLRYAFCAVLVLGLGGMTLARANLWGNQHDQALLWATMNPASPRAQAYAAQAEMAHGEPLRAIARLKPRLAASPQEVQLALNLFAAECAVGHVEDDVMEASFQALRSTRDPGSLLTSWFERLIDQTHQSNCPQANFDTTLALLDAAAANPHLRTIDGRMQDIHYLRGRVALAQRQGNTALAEFDAALKKDVRPAAALKQAALLGSAGRPRLGLDHLNLFDALRHQARKPAFGMQRVHAWVLKRQNYWPNEEARLRRTLQEDVAAQATP